jgi:hypothetical protein
MSKKTAIVIHSKIAAQLFSRAVENNNFQALCIIFALFHLDYFFAPAPSVVRSA